VRARPSWMLLLEPGGAAQAGGSLSGSVSSDCRTAGRSCARFCSLRRTRFSRNALASFASRAARSMLFLAAIRGGSLILRCNKSAAKLSRSRRRIEADFSRTRDDHGGLARQYSCVAGMAPLFTHPIPSAASITQGLPTVIDLLALPAAGTSGITLRSRLGPISRPGGCRSSVVEHSLGKGEVVGSIPTGSTSLKGAEMLVLRGFFT
jgi:hypothetical protein